MKTIGITGGVGSGKSSILTYLEQNYNCIILKADEIANQLKLPGRECYQTIILLPLQKVFLSVTSVLVFLVLSARAT